MVPFCVSTSNSNHYVIYEYIEKFCLQISLSLSSNLLNFQIFFLFTWKCIEAGLRLGGTWRPRWRRSPWWFYKKNKEKLRQSRDRNREWRQWPHEGGLRGGGGRSNYNFCCWKTQKFLQTLPRNVETEKFFFPQSNVSTFDKKKPKTSLENW